MAWKEYSEFSDADKKHQDSIQKMIVCQSQLDRAVDIARDRAYDTDEDHLKGIKDIASNLVDWVYEKANEQDSKPDDKTSGVLPTPTAAQAKVLKKIAVELKQDVETIKLKVLDYAEKNYNIRKYPENIDSAETFVKALK